MVVIKGFVSGVEVQDFTGNKNKDILLKTYTDENKSVMSAFVADFGYDIPQNIMSDFRGISPDFSLIDGYVVNCKLINGQEFSVNLENKRQMLVENGVFDDFGKVKTDKKVYANTFCGINAVDYDGDLQYELEGVQSIVAGGNEMELFKIYSVQKFMDGKWNLVKIEVKY